MNKIITLIFLTLSLLLGNGPAKEFKKPPLSFSLPLLKTIQKNAIIMGTGPVQAHVFIDPVCPRSQDFVTLIAENKKMQSLYTYHFYLYELERFHSKALIQWIYRSDDLKQALIDVMVKKIQPLLAKGQKSSETIKLIKKIATKIGVYKRPYLILVKKGKK